jgi:hypothetical protein
MNWKGCGKKQLWPISGSYPTIHQEGLRKLHITMFQMAGRLFLMIFYTPCPINMISSVDTLPIRQKHVPLCRNDILITIPNNKL